MLILGLILIAAGALAIVAAVFTTSGTAEFLNTDVSSLTIYLLGLGSGIAILWGFTISKFGTKRSLRHRREQKELGELSSKLDRVEAERRSEVDDEGERPTL